MPPRQRSRQPAAGKPARLRASKAAVGLLLTVLVVRNCRSPNHLDGSADQRRDAWVGDWHLTWGLGLAALQTALGAVLYLARADSAARRPWSGGEALGAMACAAGYALRTWCYATLGRFFTYEVGIRQGHKLVATGPYALLLHPSYLGTALLAVGYAWYVQGGPRCMLRRPLVSALLVATGAAVLVMRVTNEERVLAAHFGEQWEAHAAARWRLIPYLI